MRKKEVKTSLAELEKIKQSDKPINEKILDALNTMPSIRNKNVRKIYSEIYATVYGMIENG